MKSYVVTEGPYDVELLRRIIAGRIKKPPEILAAGVRSSVVALATSLLIDRCGPVALVMDSNTHNENSVREQKIICYELMKRFAIDISFRVFFAQPSLEVILLETPELIGQVFEQKFSEDRLMAATIHPGQSLARMTEESRFGTTAQLVQDLDPEQLDMLTEHPLMRSLLQFLERPVRWKPSDDY